MAGALAGWLAGFFGALLRWLACKPPSFYFIRLGPLPGAFAHPSFTPLGLLYCAASLWRVVRRAVLHAGEACRSRGLLPRDQRGMAP